MIGGAVLTGASPASAAPTPGPTAAVPAPQKPTVVCTIPSSSAVHITGLGVTKNGYVAIDGRNTDYVALKIYYLNSSCKRTVSQSYGGKGANDPEDLAVASNGDIWIADIGDSSNPPSRPSVAVWKVTSQTSSKLYRFTYPNGAQNAAAMLLSGDGTPIFITKVASGPAKLFEPTGPLSTAGTPLKQVGTFQPQQTGSSSKFGLAGQNWVTGAATSPDGKKVVIRTYSDAYEWDVTNGDLIGAITKGKPTITPLSSDEQGEAITYTSDSASFLTVSNVSGATSIYKWKPTVAGKATSASKKLGALAGNTSSGGFKSWLNSLSLHQWMFLLGGIGLFGLLLIVIGILGITRSRKVARDAAAREKAAGARSGAARAPAAVGADGGGVYGSARSAPGSSRSPSSSSRGGQYSGGQYGGDGGNDPYGGRGGGQYSGGQYGGGNYGGGRGGGGQNGRPQSGGGDPGVYGRPVDPYTDDPDSGRPY